MITLGDHILKRRLDIRLEQKQVAEIIGTDKWSIANWEHNRSRPRTRYLPKIIDFLGYTPKDLFTAKTLGEKIHWVQNREMMLKVLTLRRNDFLPITQISCISQANNMRIQ